MTSAVDGLISGLNTSQLISQLMQAEAAPQQRLKDKVTSRQAAITAYQSVNTKLSTLQTAAKALASTAWQAGKTVSSSDAVVGTAAAGAAAGSLTFNVVQLARAAVVTVGLPPTGPVLATPGAGIDVTIGHDGTADNPPTADTRVTTNVAVTTDTVQGAADAINAAGLAVRATVVTTDSGTKLQLTSTKTGLASDVAVTGFTAASQVAVAAQNAKIEVGNLAAGGYAVSSDTNTFANVMSGVTLTVTKPATDVTLTVSSDASGLADKMQALADAFNAATTEISSQTSYNAATKKSGALVADRNVRDLRNQMLTTISAGQPAVDGLPAYGSFETMGFKLDRYGKVTFDRDKFLAAYEADPAKIESAVSKGLSQNLEAVTTKATDTTNGVLAISVTGNNSYIKSLTRQIEDMDVRLASRRAGLQRQFSQLEVSLGKLKEQSSWLSGQLANL